jgi:ADP-sugar diphosphatase
VLLLLGVQGQFLPGIIFMRGGSVGLLVILEAEEQRGEEYAVVVKQPRLPLGRWDHTEIPAGMLDDSGNFCGKAAEELQEETGIRVNEDELVDLNAAVGQPASSGVFLSCGGSDESMRFFLSRQVWKRDAIDAIRGKLAGLREHGELITVEVLPYSALLAVPDGKTLCAAALYERYKQQQQPPPLPPQPQSA